MKRLGSIPASFQARMILGYVIIAAVFALAWAWSLYGPLNRAVLENQTRQLTAVAQAGSTLAEETSSSAEDLATRIVANTDLRLTIVAADGAVLADSLEDPSSMENHADRPEVAAALSGTTGTDRRRSATRGDDELYVAVPATLDGEAVALRVAQPVAVASAVARSWQRIGVILLAAAIIVSSAVALSVARAASRPIDALSSAARKMADGDLSTRVPSVPPDLKTMADALTELRAQMRARIGQLQSEQLTLRTALDGLADAVFVLDDREIRLANHSSSELFRAPVGGWRGRRFDRAGLAASLVGEVERLLALGGGAAEIGPDPTGRWLRCVVLPIEGSQPDVWLVVVADITERARVDQVRRDFVANASHELKTPVAGIQLLAESATTAASDGDVAQSLAFSDQIAEEAARLKRLVGDLLDLSRLEMRPEPGSVADIRPVVDNAITGHRSAAARKGLDLTARFDAVAGVDVFAAADATDVTIALDNLIDNAINYTESGEVAVAVEIAGDTIEIAVSDTGIGIPAEDLPRVFERFYRVDRARSRESGGTGLGLALVRHVIERSGGGVEVVSEPGRGTTFTLRLPRAKS